MHTKWHNGEARLLDGYNSATDCLNAIRIRCELPSYVMLSLGRRNESEVLLADTGEPNYCPPNVTIEDFSALMADLSDETADTPLLFNEPTISDVAEDSTPPSNF